MGRVKSPCGSYPAYQRHLREMTAVDDACRRAQQAHDAARGRGGRERDQAVVPMPIVSTQRRDQLRSSVIATLHEIVAAAESDDLYGVIDRAAEFDDLLDDWCEAQDGVDFEAGYPDHPPELRARLLAASAIGTEVTE